MTGQLTDILVEFGFQGRITVPSIIVFFFFARLLSTQNFLEALFVRYGTHGQVKTSLCELLCASWVNKQFAIYNLQIFFLKKYTFCLQGGNASEKNCNHKPS